MEDDIIHFYGLHWYIDIGTKNRNAGTSLISHYALIIGYFKTAAKSMLLLPC